jgi:hypothetical protein
MKTVDGVRVAAGVAPAGFNFPIPQSADPAGAEARRYSENRQFILRLFAATVCLNCFSRASSDRFLAQC